MWVCKGNEFVLSHCLSKMISAVLDLVTLTQCCKLVSLSYLIFAVLLAN